jgi:hypothetical protein
MSPFNTPHPNPIREDSRVISASGRLGTCTAINACTSFPYEVQFDDSDYKTDCDRASVRRATPKDHAMAGNSEMPLA